MMKRAYTGPGERSFSYSGCTVHLEGTLGDGPTYWVDVSAISATNGQSMYLLRFGVGGKCALELFVNDEATIKAVRDYLNDAQAKRADPVFFQRMCMGYVDLDTVLEAAYASGKHDGMEEQRSVMRRVLGL